MEPSAPEQQLLDFAVGEFGEPLSQFLLTGLGEEPVDRRWRFTITYINDGDVRLERQVEVLTFEPEDGSSCLPRKRDPLMLLALLQLLLHKGQGSKFDLLYSLEDVLRLLGWDDTGETRQEIDEAINRYFLLMYMWELNRSELSRRKLSFYKVNERPVTEYRTVDREVGEEGLMKRVYNQVKFNEFFINGLLRRNLFGIEWNQVSSLNLCEGLSLS